MNKARLEAFSDGVIAIIITIMVLEIKVPHNAEWVELVKLLPVFLSYIISFLLVGIYWGNHTIIVYGILLILCGLSYGILQNIIIKSGFAQPEFMEALKKQNNKVLISFIADLAAIGFAHFSPIISGILLTIQSLIWLIPDKNIEKALKKEHI